MFPDFLRLATRSPGLPAWVLSVHATQECTYALTQTGAVLLSNLRVMAAGTSDGELCSFLHALTVSANDLATRQTSCTSAELGSL